MKASESTREIYETIFDGDDSKVRSFLTTTVSASVYFEIFILEGTKMKSCAMWHVATRATQRASFGPSLLFHLRQRLERKP